MGTAASRTNRVVGNAQDFRYVNPTKMQLQFKHTQARLGELRAGENRHRRPNRPIRPIPVVRTDAKKLRLKKKHEDNVLMLEYNAWLRSLGSSINEDGDQSKMSSISSRRRRREDSWYSQLRQKISLLFKQKQHRKSAIVWPEYRSPKGAGTGSVPKVQLAFSNDKKVLDDLRVTALELQRRRNEAATRPLYDDYDEEAAFYLEQSFQCANYDQLNTQRRKDEQFEMDFVHPVEPRHENFTTKHGRSRYEPSGNFTRYNFESLREEIPQAPSIMYRSPAVVLGPKVLPTGEEHERKFASRSMGDNLASNERLAARTDFAYSSFYGHDSPTPQRDVHAPPKRANVASFTHHYKPESSKSDSSRHHVAKKSVPGRSKRTRTPSLGPGNENFFFQEAPRSYLSHDALSHVGESSFENEESFGEKNSKDGAMLETRGSTSLPRYTPSTLVWRNDKQMMSTLQSISCNSSSYHVNKEVGQPGLLDDYDALLAENAYHDLNREENMEENRLLSKINKMVREAIREQTDHSVTHYSNKKQKGHQRGTLNRRLRKELENEMASSITSFFLNKYSEHKDIFE